MGGCSPIDPPPAERLLVPQRFHRIESRGAHGGQHAENHTR
jgi:hypothetical protein